jgi:NAD(P)-dependent dehydrogenase (short-subunit alcohol dehydrogenase family)
MGGVRNRVAVVTGAAAGLGREIAQLLAREGAPVVLGDVEPVGLERTASAITAAGGVALAVAGDLTEEEPARRLIDAAVDRFGRLEILVNVVGGSRNAKVWEMPVEDWDFVLRLNLRSTFLCTRAAVPHMIRGRHGRIVCMSSGAREGTPWIAYYAGGAAYSAAKAVVPIAVGSPRPGLSAPAVAGLAAWRARLRRKDGA